MKIIEPSYEILDRRNMTAAQKIEQCGRLAYKSEDKITEDSAIKFFRKMMESKHFPVIEFSNIHVYIKINRPAPNECEYDNTQETIDDFLGALFGEKYLNVSPIIEDHKLNGFIVSGTVRAFIESLQWDNFENAGFIERQIILELTENQNIFPFNLPGIEDNKGPRTINAYLVSTTQVKNLIPDSYEQHLMCAVRFIHNRAFTHELVRHRPCSFIQESQRYCRYSEEKFGNEVTFIDPRGAFEIFKTDELFLAWQYTMEEAENNYLLLLQNDASPQAARTVLPNSCKTEIILYATISEWRHIFKMRTSPAAEPSMRQVMIPLHEEFFTEDNMKLWE